MNIKTLVVSKHLHFAHIRLSAYLRSNKMFKRKYLRKQKPKTVPANSHTPSIEGWGGGGFPLPINLIGTVTVSTKCRSDKPRSERSRHAASIRVSWDAYSEGRQLPPKFDYPGISHHRDYDLS